MPPKQGSPSAQQKADESPRGFRESHEGARDIKTGRSQALTANSLTPLSQTLSVTANTTDIDMIPTPNTTMEMFLGPETEAEKHGRDVRNAMRERAEQRQHASSKTKQANPLPTPVITSKELPALPEPLDSAAAGRLNQLKTILGGNEKKKNAWYKPRSQVPYTNPRSAELEKAFDQCQGAFLRNPSGMAARKSSIQPQPTFYQSSAGRPNQYLGPAYPVANPNYSGAWPLPPYPIYRPSVPEFFPPQGYGPRPSHWSTGTAQTVSTIPSYYLEPAAKNDAIIYSNSHDLAPTNSGGYATSGRARLVQRATVTSTSGVIVSPQTTSTNAMPEIAESAVEQHRRASAVESLYNRRALLRSTSAPILSLTADDAALATSSFLLPSPSSPAPSGLVPSALRVGRSRPRGVNGAPKESDRVLLAAIDGVRKQVDAVRAELAARLDGLEGRLDRLAVAMADGRENDLVPGDKGKEKGAVLAERLVGMPPHIPFGGMGVREETRMAKGKGREG